MIPQLAFHTEKIMRKEENRRKEKQKTTKQGR